MIGGADAPVVFEIPAQAIGAEDRVRQARAAGGRDWDDRLRRSHLRDVSGPQQRTLFADAAREMEQHPLGEIGGAAVYATGRRDVVDVEPGNRRDAAVDPGVRRREVAAEARDRGAG